MAIVPLTVDDEVLGKFLFYAGIVLLKTIMMSILTARVRLQRNVFPTIEDYGKTRPKTLTVDDDVDRLRRIHQNDLENIVPFVLIGILYVITGPDIRYATWYFRLFAGSRLVHTIVYMWAVPQPARALSYITGFVVNVMMLVKVITSGSY